MFYEMFTLKVEVTSLSVTGSKSTKRCGGTLVSGNVVLTAAHCVFDVLDNDNARAKEVLSIRTLSGREYNVTSLGLVSPRNDKKLVKMNERFSRKFQQGLGRVLLEDPYYRYNIAVLHLERSVVGANPISLQSRNLNSGKDLFAHFCTIFARC